MSDLQFTVRQLRALAGRAFERGERYWQQGAVRSFAVDGDSVVGEVDGGDRYRVRITPKFGIVVSRCTCPMETGCKHAVALGLAYLAESRPGAQKPPERQGFATRAEAIAWARTHRVEYALEYAADVVRGEVGWEDPRRGGSLPAWLPTALGRLPLREIASHATAAQHFGGMLDPQTLVTAARTWLEREVESVRVGLDEEELRAARTLAAPDSDGPRAILWAKLAALREQQRDAANPRSRAALADGAWMFVAEARTIYWREDLKVARSSPPFGTAPLGASFTLGAGGVEQLACTCAAGGAACTHRLALLDATLDALADPARVDELRAVAAELLRPAWSRALQALEQLDAQAAAPRAAVEVWWAIDASHGTATVEPLLRKPLKRGGLSAGTRLAADRLLAQHDAELTEADRAAAQALFAWFPTPAAPYPVRALAALVGHPRVVLDGDPDVRIAISRAALGFTALPAGDVIRLEPAVDGERISPRLLGPLLETAPAGAPIVLLEPERNRCLLVDATADARALWSVLAQHGDAFPPEAHAPLLDRLARFEGRMPVAVPESLKGTQVPASTVTVARVRLLPDLALELELFVRPGPGAPMFAPGAGPRDVLLARPGSVAERRYVRRKLGDEDAIVRTALAQLPLGDGAEEGPPYCFRLRTPDDALALVAALGSPPPGIEAEWVDRQPIVAGVVQPKQLRVVVEHERDWFGIVGEAKVEAGRIELAVLLDAARRQQRFVKIGEDRWVELSTTLRERLEAVADQTFAARAHTELSPGAVAAVRELGAAGVEVESAPAWTLLTDRLAASLALRPKVPAGLNATLRDYQIAGHAWLARIAAWGAGACLADDMGLGKTVQAIALLLDRAKTGPALVLAPTSVALNWVAELEKFAPTLRPIAYGQVADREAVLASLKPKDVLVVSYGLLVNDAEALAAVAFGTLIVDEAQALKNAATRRARAARALKADFRVALSGTPFENHLGELWSVFAVIFPGLFGSWEQFREKYAGPIERTRDPRASAALSRVLRPFLLRRTKGEVAKELPARTEIAVPVALSKDEWQLYEDARLAAVAELTKSDARDEQQRFQVLAALTRLRLLASHPKLYDPRSPIASSKLRRAMELLEELRGEGHRALVFSQFTSHLALVREALEAAGFSVLYLDGATPPKKRAELVAAFQAGEGEVFLISLKAGGTGINLTGADYVLHLDPWWNPASEDQATDRAHRIGQTKPVTVYRLIARGTIEEQIITMHGAKRALVAGVLEGTDVAGRLTTKDLVRLLEAGDSGSSDE